MERCLEKGPIHEFGKLEAITASIVRAHGTVHMPRMINGKIALEVKGDQMSVSNVPHPRATEACSVTK